jgi:hypothetical protein
MHGTLAVELAKALVADRLERSDPRPPRIPSRRASRGIRHALGHRLMRLGAWIAAPAHRERRPA